jgi:hypothetical protein
MRRVLLSALVVLVTVLADPVVGKGVLDPGKNLPGVFHAYNVTGAARGRYHCLLTEYDLDPVVLLIHRGTDDTEGFKALRNKLDAAIARNSANRLRGVVVVLSDDLPNVSEDDDKREEVVKRVEKLADGLKNVVVCLASKDDLKKYELDDSALTAVLFHKLKVVASHRVARDKLDKADSEAVKAILDDVAKKLR